MHMPRILPMFDMKFIWVVRCITCKLLTSRSQQNLSIAFILLSFQFQNVESALEQQRSLAGVQRYHAFCPGPFSPGRLRRFGTTLAPTFRHSMCRCSGRYVVKAIISLFSW